MASQLVYGLHAVRSALLYTESNVQEPSLLQLWVDKKRVDQRIQEIIKKARQQQIPLHLVSRQELDKRSKGGRHQGVIAESTIAAAKNEQDLEVILEQLEHPGLFLILDGIQDPHNLGACLRSADAAGVDAVIVAKDKSVGMTATVRKVACGAEQRVAFIQVTNLVRTLQTLQYYHIWIVGTSDAAQKNLYETDLTDSIAIVMGAEGKGMRPLTEKHCDILAAIPMSGFVESLNVSVATGIMLFEAKRQRLVKNGGATSL